MRYLIRLSKLIDALNDRLATPTEAGAMGTVGALMLAVLRHPKVGRSSRIFWGGLAAAGVAAIIGIYPECPAMGTRSLRCRSC